MATPTAVKIQQQVSTAYNGLGRFYDLYWRNLSPKLIPALDRLLLRSLRRKAAVLDLCCGTGQMAAAMSRRGFDVTGLDGSEDMIRFAQQNAPRAFFVVEDARTFDPPRLFEAVISTGDSMNHMLTAEDLTAVFRRVRAGLAEDGRFVFDMNMAEAFETQWHKSSTVVSDEHLLHVRGKYDRRQRLGTTEVILFTTDGIWRRSDFQFLQRCYSQLEVKSLLLDSGFRSVSAHPANSFGIRGRLAIGRTFFLAIR